MWNRFGCSGGPALPAAMLHRLPSAVTFQRKSPGISRLHVGFVMPERKLRAVKPVALVVQGVVWNLERARDRHGPLTSKEHWPFQLMLFTSFGTKEAYVIVYKVDLFHLNSGILLKGLKWITAEKNFLWLLFVKLYWHKRTRTFTSSNFLALYCSAPFRKFSSIMSHRTVPYIHETSKAGTAFSGHGNWMCVRSMVIGNGKTHHSHWGEGCHHVDEGWDHVELSCLQQKNGCSYLQLLAPHLKLIPS